MTKIYAQLELEPFDNGPRRNMLNWYAGSSINMPTRASRRDTFQIKRAYPGPRAWITELTAGRWTPAPRFDRASVLGTPCAE